MPTKRFNERKKLGCMSVWLGGIFLKDEGGYEIVLKSLAHYKKRLRSIGESPELKEAAAMFAPILQSQAQKRYPMVIGAMKKIEQMLQGVNICSIIRRGSGNFRKSVRMSSIRYCKGTRYRSRIFYEVIRRFTRGTKRFRTN